MGDGKVGTWIDIMKPHVIGCLDSHIWTWSFSRVKTQCDASGDKADPRSVLLQPDKG